MENVIYMKRNCKESDIRRIQESMYRFTANSITFELCAVCMRVCALASAPGAATPGSNAFVW